MLARGEREAFAEQLHPLVALEEHEERGEAEGDEHRRGRGAPLARVGAAREIEHDAGGEQRQRVQRGRLGWQARLPGRRPAEQRTRARDRT